MFLKICYKLYILKLIWAFSFYLFKIKTYDIFDENSNFKILITKLNQL